MCMCERGPSGPQLEAETQLTGRLWVTLASTQLWNNRMNVKTPCQ